MIVKSPGGIFSFLSGICFTAASLFSDILLIRVCLLFAYIFLLVTGALGNPVWPGVVSDGHIGLETIVFAVINIVTHSIAIARLLYDERSIQFHGVDEERLWRFLYRRGGFERLEARQVLDHGSFRHVCKGEYVLTEEESSAKICILIEGKAEFRRRQIVDGNAGDTAVVNLDSGAVSGDSRGNGDTGDTRDTGDGTSGRIAADIQGTLLSGSIFDMRLASIFGVYTGFEDVESVKTFAATAMTDCQVFDIPFDKLDDLASRCGPAVSSYFRNFLLCDVALQLEYRTDGHAVCSSGLREDDAWREGAMSRDFADPLDEPTTSFFKQLKGFFRLFGDGFSWLVPSGIRHVGLRGLPRTGIAATRRLRAKQQAMERAELVVADRARRAGLFQRVSSKFQRQS